MFLGSYHRLTLRQLTTREVIDQKNELVEIWVLLTRHVTNTKRKNDFVALRLLEEEDISSNGAHTHDLTQKVISCLLVAI
jgi:hypothetical protein